MAIAWRPGFLWLPTGLCVGAASGALMGMAIVLVATWSEGVTGPGEPSTASVLVSLLLLGVVYGGMIGAGVGLLVGVPLVFLVGAHLARHTARRRALVLGALLPPLCMVAVLAALSDSVMAFGLLLGAPAIGSAVLGAPLAWWAAGVVGEDRTRAQS